MILDEKDLGIGKINIANYNFEVRGEKRTAHAIYIHSMDESCNFSFSTTIKYPEFNKLELNKRINLITGHYDYVDEDDIGFTSKNGSYILTHEDVEMFLTKIAENKFLLEFETSELSGERIPKIDLPDNLPDKHLIIKTILDFNILKKQLNNL